MNDRTGPLASSEADPQLLQIAGCMWISTWQRFRSVAVAPWIYDRWRIAVIELAAWVGRQVDNDTTTAALRRHAGCAFGVLASGAQSRKVRSPFDTGHGDWLAETPASMSGADVITTSDRPLADRSNW